MPILTIIKFLNGITTVLEISDKADIPHLYNTISFDINSYIQINKGEVVSLKNELWEVVSVDVILKEPYQEFKLDNEDYCISILVDVKKHTD